MGAGSWWRRRLGAIERAIERRPFGRRTIIACVIVFAVIVAARMLLDPIATHFTRRELNAQDGMRGDFQRLHISVLPPAYEIRRLKVVEHPADDWAHPLIYVEHLRATVSVRDLMHARLSAMVRLDDPKIIVTRRAPAGPGKGGIPDVGAALEQVIPARVDRIEVRGGELLFRDLTAPRHPEIWLHRVELAAENLATRPGLAGGRPATVSASAKLGRSGDVSLFASANLFQPRSPEFAGNVAVRGWKVAELYDLEEPRTKLQTPEGTLDLFAEFAARGGAISGGVKPVLKDVKVRPTSDHFGNKLKAWVADKTLHLFSDRVPDRNAVVTIVPIEGRLDQPDVQVWPAILGVVRNAFVQGITSGLAHLPPPESEKKEGVLTQAKRAIDKNAGPPRAQPADGKKQDEKKQDGAPAKP